MIKIKANKTYVVKPPIYSSKGIERYIWEENIIMDHYIDAGIIEIYVKRYNALDKKEEITKALTINKRKYPELYAHYLSIFKDDCYIL